MKREFLMHAHTFKPEKDDIGGWFMSEKCDGMRAFWDGGISKGIPSADVPWANVEKNARFKEEEIATGLWSRYGKVIRAPKWWVDLLPPTPLDGELYIGRGKYQPLMSIVKNHYSTNWDQVGYIVLDSPRLDVVLQPGIISGTNFTKIMRGCVEWANDHGAGKLVQATQKSFEGRYLFLKGLELKGNIEVLKQTRLTYTKYLDTVNHTLDCLIEQGGEGLMFKKLESAWVPERSHELLKFKPWNDDEGVVLGYTWGKEGKLAGLMGNLLVLWKGKQFELSGFTDEERSLHHVDHGAKVYSEWKPGQAVAESITNLHFPRGTKVTFKYRELTDSGIPKEGRYFRKRLD